ncbi:MAG: sugar ABC transporter permease [Albidovulum sp.]|nr:sugar ABC transporter permease [Albidovulum sp.]MDE0533810.1 sugar ABC transporter permease [Albidovulum sp.]
MANQSAKSASRNRSVPRLKFRDERIFYYVALGPTTLVIALVVALPIIYTFGLGFFIQNTLIRTWRFVGLSNYSDLLTDADFWFAFWNGVVFTVGSTAVATVFGLAIAILLDCKFRGRGPLRALVIFPYIVPSIVVAFIWKFIFSGRGILNDFLGFIGAQTVSVPWLGDQRYAMMAVILISAWTWFPFAAITLLAAIQNVPDNIYEAAALDGAGPVRRFFHLTLPLLAPALMVVVLIRAIWAFRNYDMIWLLTEGGPIGATEVLPIMAYKEAFGLFRMGHASAVSVSLMVFVTLLAAVHFRVGARLRKAYDTS